MVFATQSVGFCNIVFNYASWFDGKTFPNRVGATQKWMSRRTVSHVCVIFLLCTWERGGFVIFRLFKSISFFVNWILRQFFHILLNTTILCLLWSYFDSVVIGSWDFFFFVPRGRVDDLSFFEYLSPFCFLSIEFHYTFSILYKILPYFVYYSCI